MQDDAAEELHIKVHHVPGHRLIADRETMTALFQAARRVLHDRERFRQDLGQSLPLLFQVRNFRELFLPRCRFCPQSVIRQVLELLVELVNPAHDRHQALELALIFRSQYFL